MDKEYYGVAWAELHGAWSSFAARALRRTREFLVWWEAHRGWPASEPARIEERPRGEACA